MSLASRRPTLPANLRGMLWMALAGLLFVGLTALVRGMSTNLHPLQIGCLRYVFGVLMLAPLFAGARLAQLRTRRPLLHVVRGALHTVGVLLWFWAMSRISLAEVTALNFTSPIFAAIGAVLLLGEHGGLQRAGAILLGFTGAMVVVRPGFAAVEWGQLAMLVAAPLFAASKLIAKVLTRTDSTPSVVFYQSLCVALFSVPAAAFVWTTPTLPQLGLLTLLGTVATLAHLCTVQALKIADIGATQSVEFLQLVWATLVGLLVFAEVPDRYTMIGGAMIIASATWLARREALRRRPVALPTAAAAND